MFMAPAHAAVWHFVVAGDCGRIGYLDATFGVNRRRVNFRIAFLEVWLAESQFSGP